MVGDTAESIITSSPGQITLTISEFQQGGNAVDLFECMVNNSLGGVVSEAIGLVEAASGTDMPGRGLERDCYYVCVLVMMWGSGNRFVMHSL